MPSYHTPTKPNQSRRDGRQCTTTVRADEVEEFLSTNTREYAHTLVRVGWLCECITVSAVSQKIMQVKLSAKQPINCLDVHHDSLEARFTKLVI